MASGSGCCAPLSGLSHGQDSDASPKNAQMEMTDACSIGIDAPDAEGSCTATGTAHKSTFQGACCTADELPTASEAHASVGAHPNSNAESDDEYQATCYVAEQAAGIQQDEPDSKCEDACCSKAPQAVGDPSDVPACCKGKQSPCCDVSCLDRLAARECHQQRVTCDGEPLLLSTILSRSSREQH